MLLLVVHSPTLLHSWAFGDLTRPYLRFHLGDEGFEGYADTQDLCSTVLCLGLNHKIAAGSGTPTPACGGADTR